MNGAKKAILLVPLTYNDGTRVPEEVLDEIYDALFVMSGGHTTAGTVQGAYRMRDGTKHSELLLQVWVTCEDAERQALRNLAARFCALLGQESMYLEFSESAVEFVPPVEEA